ncbi:histidinol-phosphate aminotransferase 2 [Marinobacterium nitratireducens]|uniref:Histidinol-phosphate aminotransferase n=1 Tax=Marinobacterium nitratireducens TaxID=518897 RepID=A0A918DTF8_9GAMM|nr:histidinol-phosphate transaminase [Marinobacterium nitratireducens]GGO82661.1 histidinol-phosphate aminotransferase 2 [Marinobacterium nitratireducens]
MGCDFIARATPGVQGLEPYVPGKPAQELERELGLSQVVKLASNENPLGPSRVALAAAQQALSQLHLYPDASGYRFKQALQRVLGLAPEHLTLGNGSNDVLELLARTFVRPGDEVIYSQYAFLVYPIVTRASGATAVVTPAHNWGHDLDAMLAAVTERTRLIFIANPNNPTGTWLDETALTAFLDALPEQVIVVLDEAYTEYVREPGFPDGLELLRRYRNLVVTRTFSKAYGLAGLRVGYAAADLQITDLLNRVRQPFNVSVPALAAAEAVLDDHDYLARTRDCNSAGMAQLTEGLRRLGLDFIPSAGNFVAFDCGRPAAPVYQQLLERGVILRPVANYAMPNHLRATIGLAAENERCLEALAEVLT